MAAAKVTIIEDTGHPAPGALGNQVGRLGPFEVRLVNPNQIVLKDIDVLVLNNLSPNAPLPESSILRFLARGNGVLCIHDSVFPGSINRLILEAAGVRHAWDSYSHTDRGPVMALANAPPDEPLQRIAIQTCIGE